jgi:hypothetical protein
MGWLPHRHIERPMKLPRLICEAWRPLIQINFSARECGQSTRMQTIRKRLADIRGRIAEAERRLADLENCAPDHGMTAMLADNVAATLKLLREHAARLENRLLPVKAGENRR